MKCSQWRGAGLDRRQLCWKFSDYMELLGPKQLLPRDRFPSNECGRRDAQAID
jgi:hypothetical protein